MHPALAALTALEAAAFGDMHQSIEKIADWCDRTGAPFNSETTRYIWDLAKQVPPPPPPPPPPLPHPRRTDTEELKELVRRAPKLPPMVKIVGRLCLIDGASLTQVAAYLGISRETVRSHLRRLRAINTMVKERQVRCQTERSRGMR
jgi:DNA-directed RNA polymerase specialized sigma24 family protein